MNKVLTHNMIFLAQGDILFYYLIIVVNMPKLVPSDDPLNDQSSVLYDKDDKSIPLDDTKYVIKSLEPIHDLYLTNIVYDSINEASDYLTIIK